MSLARTQMTRAADADDHWASAHFGDTLALAIDTVLPRLQRLSEDADSELDGTRFANLARYET